MRLGRLEAEWNAAITQHSGATLHPIPGRLFSAANPVRRDKNVPQRRTRGSFLPREAEFGGAEERTSRGSCLSQRNQRYELSGGRPAGCLTAEAASFLSRLTRSGRFKDKGATGHSAWHPTDRMPEFGGSLKQRANTSGHRRDDPNGASCALDPWLHPAAPSGSVQYGLAGGRSALFANALKPQGQDAVNINEGKWFFNYA